jgi:hypothetical protein
MTPSNYKNLIIEACQEITKNPHWYLSDSDFKYFSDVAKACQSGKVVLDNWRLYLKNGNIGTAKDFYDWCIDNFLDDDSEDNPFKDVKKIWEDR